MRIITTFPSWCSHLLLVLLLVLTACKTSPSSQVPYPVFESTKPEVWVRGELKGGGAILEEFAWVPGTPLRVKVNRLPRTSTLNVIGTASDAESGIKQIEVKGIFKKCHKTAGGMAQDAYDGARVWAQQTHTPPPGATTVPRDMLVSADIDMAQEIGTSDRVQIELSTEAHNFGGSPLNHTAVITYYALAAGITDADGACP